MTQGVLVIKHYLKRVGSSFQSLYNACPSFVKIHVRLRLFLYKWIFLIARNCSPVEKSLVFFQAHLDFYTVVNCQSDQTSSRAFFLCTQRGGI